MKTSRFSGKLLAFIFPESSCDRVEIFNSDPSPLKNFVTLENKPEIFMKILDLKFCV